MAGTAAIPARHDRRPSVGALARAAYRRLGERYPGTAIVLQIQLLYVVFVVGIGVLALYIDMSWDEFSRLACVTILIQTGYNAFLAWMTLRLLGPLRRWLRTHDPRVAAEAWRCAALLPVDFLRSSVRFLFPVWANLLWAIYAVIELGLPALALLAIVPAAAVAQLYAFSLLFLTTERTMRPVLEDISLRSPEAASADVRGVPLRWRLLAALPALNIVTGVVVAGISAPPDAKLHDLGVAVVVAVGVAFSISFWLSRMLADSVVAPIDELRAATDRVAEGELTARVGVASTDETGRLALSFNAMAHGLEERGRLRHALGAFVDPEIADRVTRDGIDLSGEETEISILFLDVRDFTSMAERGTPRDVVATLNRLYECVVPIVTRHGGHANKFIGDGMLAIFGAPDRRDDHADLAVAAAIDIAAAVEEQFGDELRVGVGVNSGTVLVGTIGGGGRLDFTVIGDAVNTAARVEAATRRTGDDVLITAATKALLSDDARPWRGRGDLELKGKAEPVAVFAPGG